MLWLLSVHIETKNWGKASELGNLVALEIFPRLLSSGGVETKFANQEAKSGKLGQVSARILEGNQAICFNLKDQKYV